MFTGRCKSSFVCFQLRRFHAGASTMEEGKLFLSVTVLNCHDYIFFQQKKLFQVKRLKIKPFSASYNSYERDISSISLIVDDRLWLHSVIQTGDLPSFLQILQIPMSSLLARKIYVFFYSSLKSVLLGGFSLISNKCIICTTRRCGGGFNAH